jgi:hypothetical protein
MNGPTRASLVLAGVVLLATAPAAHQAKPSAPPVAPKPTPQRPSDEGAAPPAPKLVAPIRGEARLAYTPAVRKQEKGLIITRFKVKNLSDGAIAGLKVDEFWYDKAGNAVAGAQTFRHRKPLLPGEVIEVELRVPWDPKLNSNNYKFEHANGTIKPQRVPKL